MKKLYLLLLCALCFGAVADTRLGKPLFVEDVTNEGGLLNNLAQSNQVESVGAQVGVVDAILRAYINGEILEEVAAYMATHTTNDVAHITAQERETWNAKQDALPYQTNAIPAAVIAGAPWLLSFTEQDPNVHDWAKAANKPQYGWSEITNKPNFAAVATSGQYSDLSGTPTIPTVPTAVSAFTNDAGYLTSYTESDPQAAGIASNVVTTAYIQEKLGVYLYIGQDGHCYVHTPEE